MRSALAACGVFAFGCNGGGGSTVATTVHVLRGASGGTTSAVTAGTFAQPVAAADGLWFLSPDQAKVTIDSIVFIGASSSDLHPVSLTDCAPTYQRSAADLAPLLDCPLDAPVGSWSGVTININPTASVLIDDATNGLFTTASGLVTTDPGSAAFTTVTIPNNGNGDFPVQVYFDTPLVISSSDADASSTATSLSILVDMNHTLFADVSSGSAKFNTSLPISPASVIAATSAEGKATFYSATGTAANFDGGAVTGDDTGSVRFYYPSGESGQPGFAFFVTPAPGEAYPLNAAKSQVGGYLARDAAGVICWANAAMDESWAHYSQYCKMQEVTTLGGTTTLACQAGDLVPLPVSGDTYASGCPAITSPTFTESLTLVAQ